MSICISTIGNFNLVLVQSENIAGVSLRDFASYFAFFAVNLFAYRKARKGRKGPQSKLHSALNLVLMQFDAGSSEFSP